MKNSSFTTENGLSESIVDAAEHSLPVFITATDFESQKAGNAVAEALGSARSYIPLMDDSDESRDEKETKMLNSFGRNIKLLIEKTWVEKSDEILKQQLVFRLETLCNEISSKNYTNAIQGFYPVLTDIVYLMFGQQSQDSDFLEYAVRIDPEFGLFWLYATYLRTGYAAWDSKKCRSIILLGICFLANF